MSIEYKTVRYKDEYLQALADGDYQILKRIYKEFAPGILRYIQSKGEGKADAKDVLQDAIETVLFKLKREELELSSSFQNYLFGVCKFIWRNRRRKNGRSVAVGEENLQTLSGAAEEQRLSPDKKEVVSKETANAALKWNLLTDKIKLLSEDCRMIYGLTLEGKKGEEIGSKLGKSVTHVRKIKSLCKKKLMALVQADLRYQAVYS